MKSLIKIAVGELGIKEIPGQEHEKRIIDYAKESGFKGISDDGKRMFKTFINIRVFYLGSLGVFIFKSYIVKLYRYSYCSGTGQKKCLDSLRRRYLLQLRGLNYH